MTISTQTTETVGAHVTATDAPVPMTPEQKFFLDLRGWILLPAVLSEDEIEATKAEVYAGARQSYEGALQKLLDHPAIVGILNEILSEDPFVKTIATVFDAKVPSLPSDRPGGVSQNAAMEGCRMSCVHRSKPTPCGIRSQGARYSQGLRGWCGSLRR